MRSCLVVFNGISLKFFFTLSRFELQTHTILGLRPACQDQIALSHISTWRPPNPLFTQSKGLGNPVFCNNGLRLSEC